MAFEMTDLGDHVALQVNPDGASLQNIPQILRMRRPFRHAITPWKTKSLMDAEGGRPTLIVEGSGKAFAQFLFGHHFPFRRPRFDTCCSLATAAFAA